MANLKTCPHCGEKIEDKFLTCIYCGQNIEAQDKESAQKPDPKSRHKDKTDDESVKSFLSRNDGIKKAALSSSKYNYIKKTGEWGKFTRGALWGFAIINILSLPAYYFYLNMLQIQREGYALPDQTADLYKLLNNSAFWAQVLIFITASLGFVVWFYRSYKAMQIYEIQRTKYSPKWAFFSFVVPIGWFFMPPLIMNEIRTGYTKAYLKANKDTNSVSLTELTITWWWALTLLACFVQYVSFKFIPHDKQLSSLITLAEFDLAGTAIELAAIIALIILMNKLLPLQMNIFKVKK